MDSGIALPGKVNQQVHAENLDTTNPWWEANLKPGYSILGAYYIGIQYPLSDIR